MKADLVREVETVLPIPDVKWDRLTSRPLTSRSANISGSDAEGPMLLM